MPLPVDIACLENTIQCYFFSSNKLPGNSAYWEQLCKSINERINYYSKEYLWHFEQFEVHQPVYNELSDIPNYLTSATCFGDNIEDEWFIVYIVMEISKLYKELVVQVKDSDGDFLLIEAADYLPTWANPNTTENRVFIHDGNIHLIPPNVWDIKEDIKLVQAIELVTDPKVLTTVSNEIKQIIQKRIQLYPDKIQEVFHKAVVLLPIDIAAVLNIKPSFISPLVNMYCNHDIIDKKVCKNIKYENCILTEVKFTKCLYAMLHHAKMIKLTKMPPENSKETTLGVKLTCAFHMIVNDTVSDIFSTKRFNNFLQKLQINGYFKENIEGSIEYKILLENAKEFYKSKECPLNSQVSCEIRDLIESKDFGEVIARLQSTKSHTEFVGDNDDWLNISPEQLDEFLTSRYGRPITFKKDDIVTAEKLKSELSNFLKQSSDFEGVETFQEVEDNIIDFDPDKFQDSIENVLNILSDKTCDIQIRSGENSDNESIVSDDYILESEIKSLLHDNLENSKSSSSILQNMVQSMKEEQCSGPSSNVLRTLGISKSAFLDSDDDEAI